MQVLEKPQKQFLDGLQWEKIHVFVNQYLKNHTYFTTNKLVRVFSYKHLNLSTDSYFYSTISKNLLSFFRDRIVKPLLKENKITKYKNTTYKKTTPQPSE